MLPRPPWSAATTTRSGATCSASTSAGSGRAARSELPSHRPDGLGVPRAPFTRTWIFGAHGGRIIFYEERGAHRTRIGRPQSCTPIKQPKGVVTAGFYPTASCLRHEASTNETTVSLELQSSAGEVTGAAGGDELESAVEGPRQEGTTLDRCWR